MTPEKVSLTVGYGRQSHAEREDSASLETQREKAAAWSTTKDAELSRWVEDQDVSGGLAPLDRPGFGDAVAYLNQRGGWQLVISDLSRLSRGSVSTALETIRVLHDEHGIRGDRGAGRGPETAVGEAIFTVLLAMARMEHRVTSEKIHDGKASAARAGKWLNAAPAGYVVESRERDGNGKLRPAVEGDTMRARGEERPALPAAVLREAAERVVRDGLPAAAAGLDQTDSIRQWPASLLRRTLRQRLYLGEAEWSSIRIPMSGGESKRSGFGAGFAKALGVTLGVLVALAVVVLIFLVVWYEVIRAA